MKVLLDEAHLAGAELTIPAGVLAQSWRGTPRQTRLARLLGLDTVTIDLLVQPTAKAAGVLCGLAGIADVIDVSVVIAARSHDQGIITTAPTTYHA